jgi:hypothetical protein
MFKITTRDGGRGELAGAMPLPLQQNLLKKKKKIKGGKKKI